MNILAIESSTDICGVCVMSPEGVKYFNEVAQPRIHSERLPQFIQQGIDQCGVPITAIAVATGPGSYTGLRIGVSMAKGLSYAMGLPLIPVPSLVAINDNLESMIFPRYVYVHSYADWIFIQKFSDFSYDGIPECIQSRDFRPEPGVNQLFGYGLKITDDLSLVINYTPPSSKYVAMSAMKNYNKWIERDINNVNPLYITNFNFKP